MSATPERPNTKRRSVAHSAAWALTTLIVALALVSGFSLLVFRDYRNALRELEERRIPVMLQGANLAALSNQLIARAERLLAAQTDTERRIAFEDVREGIEEIDSMLEFMGEEEQQLSSALRVLDVTMTELDTLVGQRIAIARETETVRNELLRFAAGIVEFQSEFYRREGFVSGSGSLTAWINTAVAIINRARDAGNAETLREIESIRTEISRNLESLATITDSAPAELREALQELEQELSELTVGDGGLVTILAVKANRAMQSTGRSNFARSLVNDFRMAGGNIFNQLVNSVREDVEAIRARVNQLVAIFLGIVVAATVVFVAVALRIRNHLLVRLVKLNDAILHRVSGQESTIPEGGNDEISDMADSFRFYAEEVRRREEELRKLATKDALTGVNNRRHFLELAGQEMARANRGGRPTTVLMMDIDRFKSINDTYGHPEGDNIIVKVAETCLAELREIDLFGRFGGEEFTALLPETDREGAVTVAERLREGVEGIVHQVGEAQVSVTISIGIGVASGEKQELTELITSADNALYEAKAAGRNRVR